MHNKMFVAVSKLISQLIKSIQLIRGFLVFIGKFKYIPLRRVKPDVLRQLLQDYPDKDEAQFVIDGFTRGFPLGVDPAKRPQPRGPCENSQAARERPDITRALVAKEVELGHMLGPFDEPPIPNLVFSPLHLVKKAGSEDKWRLIHNLAFPYTEESVNRSIPPEEASVQYHYIDELIALALELGPNITGCRVDFRHAFRNLPVIFEDLCLLAFSLDGKIYLNASVPFGSALSCQLFERVATVLQWIVTNVTGWRWISHYLDDFPMLARTEAELLIQMQRYMQLMEYIGMPIATDKTLGPTQLLEYLGLLLNLINLTLQIPDEKRKKNIERIDKLLDAFHRRAAVTAKTIQKVAGSLNFICAAIPAGRAFLADLYKLIRPQEGKANPTHHRRITRPVYEDMKMFKSFLVDCAEEKFRSIPFLVKNQIFNEQIELYADSAGSGALGFGCVFGNEWCAGRWSDTDLFSDFTPNIALLELYAITIAVEIWAEKLKGKFIVLRSDSQSTVANINSMKSEIPQAQLLLKHMTLTCMHFQVFVKSVHVPGILNTESDLLSRGAIHRFHQIKPSAKRIPEPLPVSLWPPVWRKEDMVPSTKTSINKPSQKRK